jgi:tRNA modification GTPase
MKTIFALSSARGKAGVAVVRLSGQSAGEILRNMAGELPMPRRAALRVLRHSGDVLDQALVIWIPGPDSFTGEDVAELHLHGSIATVNAVLAALGSMPNCVIAEPGEFTRRALENERLDLAQVEGLSDLVEAETEAQRRQAFRVFSGALGQKASNWRSDLIRAAALLEATIDFADEDVPVDVTPEVLALMTRVQTDLRAETAGVAIAERIRDGFEVAIVGPPNVGKSTLLNALAGRDAAITSDVAGTTRDVIEVRMSLRGLPVTVLDTAGLRVSEDAVESIGIERAIARAEQADLRVILLDRSGATPVIAPVEGDIIVVAKADLTGGDLSALTGEGLDDLVETLAATLEKQASGAGVAIRERHRISMRRAIEALDTAQDQLETSPELSELIAEELRNAIRALDSLVGHVDIEHILDDIFSSFCIGK